MRCNEYGGNLLVVDEPRAGDPDPTGGPTDTVLDVRDAMRVLHAHGIQGAAGASALVREAALCAVCGRRTGVRSLSVDDQFHALCRLVDPAE